MKPAFEETHFPLFAILCSFWDQVTPLGDWVAAQLALPQEDFEEAYGSKHGGVRQLMEMYAAW